MLANFIKVIFRYLSRKRFFAALNITGLSIGTACCILIYLFVRNEMSYDRFHTDAKEIYRVIRQSQINGMPYNIGITSFPFADALQQDYGDRIQSTTRCLTFNALVAYEDKAFIEEKLLLADKNFFQFFSFPLQQGQPESVLSEPNNIVLSQALATKYFGDNDPIGKIIRLDDTYDLKVTGILADMPGNTHLQFDAVGSTGLIKNETWIQDWWANSFNTYLKIPDQGDVDYLQASFPDFMNKYFAEDFARVGNKVGLALEPLHEIYFNFDTRYEDNIAHGDRRYVFVFSSVGLLLLLLASINYTNLATAQASERAREVGIRKTLGSGQARVIFQFLSESFVLCLVSMLVGMGIAQLVMPFLNSALGISLPSILGDKHVPLFLGMLLIFLTFCSGAYPAFFLSSFKPVAVLKGVVKGDTRYLFLRKGLVVFQFVISSFMIIATLFVAQQLQFMRAKDLGFNTTQLMIVRVNNGEIDRATFKERLLREKGVLHATYTSGHPGGFYDASTVNIQGESQGMRMRTLWTDEDLLQTMDLSLVAGRFFSRNFPADATSSVILNETAVRQLGWNNETAIGKRVILSQFDSLYKEVVGIVGDYHFTSLKEKIEPMIISHRSDRGHLLVKLAGSDLPTTIGRIEKIWKSYDSGFPLEFTFMDEIIDRLYTSETRQGKIFTVFAFISVGIACLGILGLASYMASQRTKEIGIRKVLGASANQVSVLLMKDLLILVIAADFLAIPLGYWAIEKWSEGFAYRVSLGSGIFIIGALSVFALAMMIVALNVSRVAAQNPVKSLRTE